MSESKEKECIISIRSNPSPTNNASSGLNNLSSNSSISNPNNNSTSSSIDDNTDNNSVDHNQKLMNDKFDQSGSEHGGDVEESLEENNEPTTSKIQYLSPSNHLELFRKLEILKEIK